MLERFSTSIGELLSPASSKPAAASAKPPAMLTPHPFFVIMIKRLEELITLIRTEYSLQPRKVVRGKDSYIDDPLKNNPAGRFLYELLQTVKNHHSTNQPVLSYTQFIESIDCLRRTPQYPKIQEKLEAFNEIIQTDIKTSMSKGGGNFHYTDFDFKAATSFLQDLLSKDTEKTPSGEMLWRICLGLKRDEGKAFVENNSELIAKIRKIPSFQAHEPMDDRRLSSVVIEDPWLFAFFTMKQLYDFFIGCSGDVLAKLKRIQNTQSAYQFPDQAHEMGSSLFSSSADESGEVIRFPTLSPKELDTKTLVNFLVNRAVASFTQNAINETVALRTFIEFYGFHREFFPVLTPATLITLFQSLDSFALKKTIVLKESALRAAALRDMAVKASGQHVPREKCDVKSSIDAAEIRGFIEFKAVLTRIEADLEKGVGVNVYFSQNKGDPKIPYLLYELVLRSAIFQYPLDKLRAIFNTIAPVLILDTLRLCDPNDTLHSYIEIGEGKYKEQFAVDKSNQVSFSRLMQLLLADDFQALRQKWAEDEGSFDMFFNYPILLKGVNFQQIEKITASYGDFILTRVNATQKEGLDAVEACPLLLAFLPHWQILENYNNAKIKQLFNNKTLPAEVIIHWLKNNLFHILAATIPELHTYLMPDYFVAIDKALLDEPLLKSMMNNETTESALMRHPSIIDAFEQCVVSDVAKEADVLRTVVRRNTGVKLITRASVNFTALREFMRDDDPVFLFDKIAIFADANKNLFEICPLLLAFASPIRLVALYRKHEKIKQWFVDKTLPAEVLIHYIMTETLEIIAKDIPELRDYLNLDFFNSINKNLLDEQLLSVMLASQFTKNVLKRYPSILRAFPEVALNNCAKDSVFLRQVARQADLIELIHANFDDLMCKGGRFTLFKKIIEVLYLNPETEAIVRRVEEELINQRAEVEKRYDKDVAPELIAYGIKQLTLDTAPYTVADDFQEHDSLANVGLHIHKIAEMKGVIAAEVQQTFDGSFGERLAAEEVELEKTIATKTAAEKAAEDTTDSEGEITRLKEMIRALKVSIRQKKETLDAMTKSQIAVSRMLERKIIVVDPIILIIQDMVFAYPYWASQFVKSFGFYQTLKQFCINALHFDGDNIKRNGDHFRALYEYAVIYIKINEYENAAKLLMEYVSCLGLDVMSQKKYQSVYQLLLNCAANLAGDKPLEAQNYILFICKAWPDVNSENFIRLPNDMRHKATQSLLSESILFAENTLSLFSHDLLSKKESMPMIIALYDLLFRGLPLINQRSPEILDLAARHHSLLTSLRMLMVDNPNQNKTLNLHKDAELQSIFKRIQQRLQNIESEQKEQNTKRDSDESKSIERKRATQFSRQTDLKIKQELDELASDIDLNLHKRPLPKGKSRASTYVNKIKSRQQTPDIVPEVPKPADTPPRRLTFSKPLDWQSLENIRREFDKNSQTGVVAEAAAPSAEELKLKKENEEVLDDIKVVLSSDDESENGQLSEEENSNAIVPPSVPPTPQQVSQEIQSDTPIVPVAADADNDWQKRMNNEIEKIKVAVNGNQTQVESVDENQANEAAEAKRKLEESLKLMAEAELEKEKAEAEEKQKLAEHIRKAKELEAVRNKKLAETAKQTKANEEQRKKEALALKKKQAAEEKRLREEAEAARQEQERIEKQKQLEQAEQEKRLMEERRKKEAEDERIRQEQIKEQQKTEEGRRKLAEEEKKRREAAEQAEIKNKVASFKQRIAADDAKRKQEQLEREQKIEARKRLREQEAQKERERLESEAKVLEEKKAKDAEEARRKEAERQKALDDEARRKHEERLRDLEAEERRLSMQGHQLDDEERLLLEEERKKAEERQRTLAAEEARRKEEERRRDLEIEAQRISMEGRKLEEEERKLREEVERIAAAKAIALSVEEMNTQPDEGQSNIVNKLPKSEDPNKEKAKMIATDLMKTIEGDEPLANDAFRRARKLSLGSQNDLPNPLHSIGMFAAPSASSTTIQKVENTDTPPPHPSADNARPVLRLMTGAVKQAEEEAQRKEAEREGRRKKLADSLNRRRSTSQPRRVGDVGARETLDTTSDEFKETQEYKLFVAAQIEAVEEGNNVPSRTQADRKQLRRSTSFTSNYQRTTLYATPGPEGTDVVQKIAETTTSTVRPTQRLQRSQSYGNLSANLQDLATKPKTGVESNQPTASSKPTM